MTRRYPQFSALARIQSLKLDKTRADKANIKFGIGCTSLIETSDVATPIRLITFHIVDVDTPFLLSIADMDSLKVKFNNLDNVMI